MVTSVINMEMLLPNNHTKLQQTYGHKVMRYKARQNPIP